MTLPFLSFSTFPFSFYNNLKYLKNTACREIGNYKKIYDKATVFFIFNVYFKKELG